MKAKVKVKPKPKRKFASFVGGVLAAAAAFAIGILIAAVAFDSVTIPGMQDILPEDLISSIWAEVPSSGMDLGAAGTPVASPAKPNTLGEAALASMPEPTLDSASTSEPDSASTPAPIATQSPDSTSAPVKTATPARTATVTKTPKNTATTTPTSTVAATATQSPMPTATATPTNPGVPPPAGPSVFVATNGNDSNDCSAQAPCRTFKRAVKLLSPGTTLVINQGVYQEQLRLNVSGAEGSPITVQPAGSVVVTASGDLVPIWITGHWINITGIEIHSSNNSGIAVEGNHVVVSNMNVHDTFKHGILVSGQYVTVQQSTIHNVVLENTDAQGSFGSALKCSMGCRDVIFNGNHVYDSYGEAIAVTRGVNVQVIYNQIGNSFAPGLYVDNSYDVVLDHNTVQCTAGMAGASIPSAILLGEENYGGWGAQLKRVTISNNTVTGCRNAFAYWGSEAGDNILRDVQILNNTFRNLIRTGIYIEADGVQNVAVTGNLIQQADGLFFSGPSGVVYEGNTESR